MPEKSHKGLVLRERDVKRGGKTFKRKMWVKAGEDEPVERKGKKEEVEVKGKFNVGDSISFMGKELKIDNISESEQTIKLSDGNVYTFGAIEKFGKIKDLEPVKKEPIKTKKRVKKPEKMVKVDIDDLNKQMIKFESKFKSEPNSEKTINDINDYTQADYTEVNQYLRDELTGDDEEYDEKIDNISNFLNKAPKVKGAVFRGMSFDDTEKRSFNNFIKKIEKENFCEFKAFTSTSVDKEVAADFSDNEDGYNISFEIKSKNGVYLNGVSKIPDEDEVLFNRDTKFKIGSIDKTNSKNIIINMEEI